MDVLEWLRATCAEFDFDVVAAYRRGGDHSWPLVGVDPDDLERKLADGGHLLPLPKEPAALANVLEVAIIDFMLDRVAGLEGTTARRGTERGYPDIEVSGAAFGDGYHAVDVKVARLGQERDTDPKPSDPVHRQHILSVPLAGVARDVPSVP